MQRFKIAESGYPYFVTESIVRWLPVFVTRETCDIVIDSLRYCREAKGLRVHAYVIMPSHMHMTLSTDGDLSSVLRDMNRHTSKKLIEHFSHIPNPPFINVFKFCGGENRPPTEHKVWQDGSHPEQVRTEAFFRQKVDYIHANPIRKGLVTDALAWTYSSAPLFYGAEGSPLEVDGIEW